MTLNYLWNEHLWPAVSEKGKMDKHMCGAICKSIWTPGCLWSYPGAYLSVCDADKKLKHENMVLTFAWVGVCAQLPLTVARLLAKKTKWECLQSNGLAMQVLRFYVLVIPLLKVVYIWVEVWHFRDLQDTYFQLVCNTLNIATPYAIVNSITEKYVENRKEEYQRMQNHQKELDMKLMNKLIELFLQDNEVIFFEWLLSDGGSNGKTKRNGSVHRTARGRSPGRPASVPQFQFRVLRVCANDGTDISQKKNDGDFNLDHTKYLNSADCYLQCRIMKEDDSNAGDTFTAQGELAHGAPFRTLNVANVENSHMQAFQFRYCATESHLDIKMPHGKKSFKQAVHGLKEQNGLHMEQID